MSKFLTKLSSLSMRQINDYMKSLTCEIEEYVDLCKNNPEFKMEREVFSILENSNFFDKYIGLGKITSNLSNEDLDDWFVDFGSVVGENMILHGEKAVSFTKIGLTDSYKNHYSFFNHEKDKR